LQRRTAFLEAGYFDAITAVIASQVRDVAKPGDRGWRVLDAGFGTGYHLSRVSSELGAPAVGAVTLLLSRSRIEWRGIKIAIIAFIGGGLIAYVPWHYDQMRQTVPPIHDITTDPDTPPAFDVVVPLREAAGANPVFYERARISGQQRLAYPEILPLSLALPPVTAFNRTLDTAQRMGWTIVAAADAAGRIEESDRSRWFGFTDDIVIRITASGSGSRIDLRSSSRLGRSNFGVNAASAPISRRCARR
jgi:uncharacterized protein (DUF1499 family)